MDLANNAPTIVFFVYPLLLIGKCSSEVAFFFASSSRISFLPTSFLRYT